MFVRQYTVFVGLCHTSHICITNHTCAMKERSCHFFQSIRAYFSQNNIQMRCPGPQLCIFLEASNTMGQKPCVRLIITSRVVNTKTWNNQWNSFTLLQQKMIVLQTVQRWLFWVAKRDAGISFMRLPLCPRSLFCQVGPVGWSKLLVSLP